MENNKLVIIGVGEFSEIAYEYFTDDSDYEVKGFAVEKRFRTEEKKLGLPVIDFEDIAKVYPPDLFEVFIAITYTGFNRVRERLIYECKRLGYKCANYISSKSFIGRGVKMEDNIFIFENNSIQHNCEIKSGVIIFGGGVVAHSSIIEENCWLAPGVVVSGFCRIGKNSFLGSHATVIDNINIASETLIGAGGIVNHEICEPGGMYVGCPVRRLHKSAYDFFKIID